MHLALARVAVLATVFSGCLGSVPEAPGSDAACGGCGDGLACDPVSRGCVAALGEGEACEKRDDGAVCRAGLVCASVVGGLRRCSRDCTAPETTRVCGAGRKCYGRPGAPGGAVGFCGTPVDEGDRCGPDALEVCAPGLVCVTPTAQTPTGRCFASCDPAQSDCGPGRSCADPFSDPRLGICTTPPGPHPSRCDHLALVYCGRAEICVRPTPASWGHCHVRCGGPDDCPLGSCVEPIDGVRFCVAPTPRCTDPDPRRCPRCSWVEDRYCGAEDVCVEVTGATVCKADCTGWSLRCPAGTTCSPLIGSASKACL